MQKTVKKIVFIALICLLGAFALFGCQNQQTRLTSESVNGLKRAMENGLIRTEWLNEYDEDKPILVIFPGESEEDQTFSPELSTAVYTHEATYLNETVNENTIGWKGNGLVEKDGTYVLTEYWTKIAGFNVLLLHYERFFAEETAELVTKTYSPYKSRYVSDRQKIDVDFGYAFYEVMSCVVYETLEPVYKGKKEIRFVGNGIGGNLAYAVADSLYIDHEKGLSDYVLPTRVTACDPYLTEQALSFGVEKFGVDGTKGTASVFAKNALDLSNAHVATELVETEEKTEENISYAYADAVRTGESYRMILDNTASLLLTESYSANSSFDAYKRYKRLAFDWYYYSIIGSDDSQEYDAESQKYPVGYPNSYSDLSNDASIVNGTNWSYNRLRNDARRPILNNRRLTNDYYALAGQNYGFNFAVGAWTPSLYIHGLRGVAFTQKEGGTDHARIEYDLHGNEKFKYVDYVLKSFRSENYQYSDLNGSTIIQGCCYFDENGDGFMNDGAAGKQVDLYVTVSKNDGEALSGRIKIRTDKSGYYRVVLFDRRAENEQITFEADGNTLYMYGYAAESASDDGVIILRSELVVPLGYEAKEMPTTGIRYETIYGNHAENGMLMISMKKFVVHSVLTENILLQRESHDEDE